MIAQSQKTKLAGTASIYKITCLMVFVNLGLGNGHTNQAIAYFDTVLSMDINHPGAIVHRNMVDFLLMQEVTG